jgi:predicted glycosyltransferase
MIFYYAAGGGLGHLTRARAVIHTLHPQDRIALLTASPFANDQRVVGDAEILKIPQSFAADLAAYQAWLQEQIARHQPSDIYLDAFPAGLFGEFCDFQFPRTIKLFHLARLLKWGEYKGQLHGRVPEFERTYVLEPLDQEHETWLANQSRAISRLTLTDPPHELSDENKRAAIRILRPSVSELLAHHPQSPDRTPVARRPLWLIVHAGSRAEIEELIAYAVEMARIEEIDPRLIVLTPAQIKDQTTDARPQTPDYGQQRLIEQFDFYPASAMFPIAERIITACGFNAMRQTEMYRGKHRFLPFERRFDNQFARACRRKGET